MVSIGPHADAPFTFGPRTESLGDAGVPLRTVLKSSKGGCRLSNDVGPRIAPGPFCPSAVGDLMLSRRLRSLRPFRDGARRQLQYSRPLPGDEVSD
jgi:hypothetical protein